MKKNNYIAPRGDLMYYLEVWDIQILRDSKISSILGEPNSQTFFVNGSQKNLSRVDKIELALFWKNKESAEHRILTLKRFRPKDEYKYVLKSLTREEFINIIPDECDPDLKDYKKVYWNKNKELKVKELCYKRKLENPWRDYNIKNIGELL
jgi:hypothetical protein